MRRSQRLIAAAVLIALSGVWRAAAAMSSFDPTECWTSSTPRKSCRAIASRFSPKACQASSRACRRICTRARRRSRDQQNRPRPPPLRRQEPKSKRGAQASCRPKPAGAGAWQTAADADAAPRKRAAPPPRRRLPSREDRAPAHHRAAARCAARNSSAAPSQQHLPHRSRRRCRAAASRADLVSHCIDTRFVKGARNTHVFYHRHHRPAQCRKVDPVQPAGRAEAGAGR